MGKNYPSPPNPQVVANAQTGSNIDTAKANATLNRINQNTPFGSSTYSITGQSDQGLPIYQQDISLSPVEQQLFNLGTSGQVQLGTTAQGMLGQVQGAYANPMDTSGAPGIASNVPGGPIQSQIAPTQNQIQGNIDTSKLPHIASGLNHDYAGPASIQGAQDAAYRSQTQYLDPQYEQGQKALENQLANQGVVQGSEAYNNAVNNYALQKQRAYQGARDSATLAGNQEQNVLFGQGLSQAELQNAAQAQGFGQLFGLGGFKNQAQQQEFAQNAAQLGAGNQAQAQGFGEGTSNAALQNQAQQEYLAQQFALRNQPLNEYNALMTGAQVQQPTFNQVPGVQQAGTNVAGIYSDNFAQQMAIANAKNSFWNNLMGLGGQLGAAAIMA